MEKPKIVCAYFDPISDYLRSDPPNSLFPDYEVMIIHYYDDLKALMLHPEFDPLSIYMVLADISLPKNESNRERLPTLLLHHHFDQQLVRGLGIFVPTYYTEDYEANDEFSNTVASKDCWTHQRFRDWEKLFQLVCAKMP